MGILDRFFRKKANPQVAMLTDTPQGTFSPFSGNAYESDIYRAAVDSIARNAAKLKGTHIISGGSSRKIGENRLNYLLQVRPNPYMSAYDLLYKLITHYFLYNNAFAYLEKDETGALQAIYPIRPLHMEYLTDNSGRLYGKFIMSGDRSYIFSYEGIFTIRRFFNDNDLLGDSNSPIVPTLHLAHTQSEAMEKNIRTSGRVRGLLRYSQKIAPEKLKEMQDEFVRDYMDISNIGGLVAIDNMLEFQPLDIKNYAIDEGELKATKTKIYEYLGLSEKIVNSSYSEEEWAAFYESVIEPLALQMSLELTDKVFTQREQAFGNQIIFEANRLQFASNATKTAIIKELMPLGLFTINQALDILNLPPVEDGERRVQTLNVVNVDLVDNYQMQKEESEDEGTENSAY